MDARNGKSARRRRPWLRFSLRTLLLLVTVIALLLAAKSNQARRQKDAVAAVTRLDGWVRYDYQIVNDKFDPSAVSPVPEWLLAQLGVDFFHDVVQVNMVYNDDGPKRIDNEQTTDEVLEHLPAFPELEVLALHEGQASDKGLEYVARLGHLEKIYLWDAHEVGDYGVRYLAKLRNLKYVHLSNSRITDEALRVFGTMPQLEGLSLQGNRFTDRGLEHLKGLKNLERLAVDLGQSNFTDAGLVHLYGMTRLKSLMIQNALVSREGLAALQRKLPNLKILHALTDPPPLLPKTIATSAPTLQFLAWEYEPRTELERAAVGTYWLRNGMPLEDQEQIAQLKQMRRRARDFYGEQMKPLHVYISHPQFHSDSFGEVALLDDDGRSLIAWNPRKQQSGRSLPANQPMENAAGPGWQFFQLPVERDQSLPQRATLRLRYSVGNWRAVARVLPNRRAGQRITEGVYLLALGERTNGRTEFSLLVEPEQAERFQFGIAAQPAQGPPIRPTDIYRRDKDGEPLVLTFQFSLPLGQITDFVLRTRDLHQTEFPHVPLLPAYALER